MAKVLTAREKRCEDCVNLISKKGIMCCDECFGQKCDEIDDCPEGVQLEQLEQLEAKAKENKIQHHAQAEGKEKRTVNRKPTEDPEKEQILQKICAFLTNEQYSGVEITNKTKILEFNIGENHYKLDLIRQRKPKS